MSLSHLHEFFFAPLVVGCLLYLGLVVAAVWKAFFTKPDSTKTDREERP